MKPKLRPLDLVGGILTGSMLSDQLYCELRLDYSIRQGEYRVPVKPGTPRAIVEEILLKQGHGRFRRYTIKGVIYDIVVHISPDAILLGRRGPKALIKAVIRNPPRVLERDLAPLELAAAVLSQSQGVEGLAGIIVVAANADFLREALRELLKMKPSPAKGPGWVIGYRVLDPLISRERVSKLLSYWLGVRKPQPNPSPNKCSICVYSNRCPAHSSQQRF